MASSVPDFAGPLPPNPAEELLNQHEPGLPTFEDVCLLNQPTLHFVPSKSRPAFARALSSALRCVILENTEEAWLKLFMLPRCVLPSLRRKGRHDKPLPVDILCNMWSDNKLGDLWDLARNRTTNHKRGACSTSINQRTKVIDQAVSLGRSGMWGNACRILQSSGIAPNNDTTWQLLKSKHPSCPTQVPPVIHTTPVSLEPDFSIIAISWSFPKDTAAGPSGLRVQHLLNVISIPLHTPICSSLRQVINILIAGKAPTSVLHFLAGASLIALNKIMKGCPPDIRPEAVGETLRRLAGKCVCALLKDKAAEFFKPLQLWRVGQVQRTLLMVSEDALRSTGWMRISFSSKLICKMLSMLSPDRRYWMNALHSSQSSYHGYLGAMGPTPCFGTHLARSLLNPECNKVIP